MCKLMSIANSNLFYGECVRDMSLLRCIAEDIKLNVCVQIYFIIMVYYCCVIYYYIEIDA